MAAELRATLLPLAATLAVMLLLVIVLLLFVVPHAAKNYRAVHECLPAWLLDRWLLGAWRDLPGVTEVSRYTGKWHSLSPEKNGSSQKPVQSPLDRLHQKYANVDFALECDGVDGSSPVDSPR